MAGGRPGHFINKFPRWQVTMTRTALSLTLERCWRAFDVQKIVALEAAADPDLVARHFDLNDDVAVPRAVGLRSS